MPNKSVALLLAVSAKDLVTTPTGSIKTPLMVPTVTQLKYYSLL